MKRSKAMASGVLVLGFVSACLVGCPGKKNPSSPGGTSPTATSTPCGYPGNTCTPTVTPTPCGYPGNTCTPTPVINWGGTNYTKAYAYDPSTTGSAEVYLQVSGSPYSTAGVTISSNSTSFPLTYCAGCTFYPSYAEYHGNFTTYQAGQTYALSSATTVGTASVTFVAPGGGITVNSNGTTVTWNYEGNQDWVQVMDINGGTNLLVFNSTGISSDVDSPYAIPASIYSGYSSPTTFVVQAGVVQNNSIANAVGVASMYEVSASVTLVK